MSNADEVIQKILMLHGVSVLSAVSPRAYLEAVEAGGIPFALYALEALSNRLLAEQEATRRLLEIHDALRVRSAQQSAAALKANQIVGKAALTYRDERLAKCARDMLHGQAYADALAALPTATTSLRRSVEQAPEAHP